MVDGERAWGGVEKVKEGRVRLSYRAHTLDDTQHDLGNYGAAHEDSFLPHRYGGSEVKKAV